MGKGLPRLALCAVLLAALALSGCGSRQTHEEYLIPKEMCIRDSPLAEAKGQSFGTRHRAALGMTQECDAVVVVVSEERGEISVAMKGELVRSLDATRLRQVLNDIL